MKILNDHAPERRRRGWLTDIVKDDAQCVEVPVGEEESFGIFNVLFPSVVKFGLLTEVAVKCLGVNFKHQALTVISMAKSGGSRFLDSFDTQKSVFTDEQGGPLKGKSARK